MKQLAEFKISTNGHLLIRQLPGMYDEYVEIDSRDGLTDDQKFTELIEYQLANGWEYTNYLSSLGYLTEAPALWQDSCKLYYDNYYAIRSAWDAFMRDGKVWFYEFDIEPTDTTPC